MNNYFLPYALNEITYVKKNKLLLICFDSFYLSLYYVPEPPADVPLFFNILSWILIFSDPAKSTKFNIDSVMTELGPMVFGTHLTYNLKIVWDLLLQWFITVDA